LGCRKYRKLRVARFKCLFLESYSGNIIAFLLFAIMIG
jgi:hypothetical protein